MSGPADEASRRDAGLSEKLEWLMLFRLVLVTFLLGSAVVVNVNDVESFGDPSYVAIVSLIVGTYVATIAWAWWLRRVDNLRRLAYAQLVGDAVLAAGLVLLTGGIDSIFTFLFFLTIFNGAVLLGRPGAMFAASCSSLGLAAIVVLQFGDFDIVHDVMPERHGFPEQLPIYALIIHLVGFFTVAALSGTLAEKLGQVGSELERRQLDIRELRALNENIVRSLSSGLITLDLDGNTIFFNAAAADITGYAFSDINMRPLVEVIPALSDVVAAAPSVVGLAARPRFEAALVRPDGREVYLGISISPLRNARGDLTGYIMIVQDVTELKTMRDAILRQEHLSAIGKLSAAIAHEIRNPLAAISGSIQMLGLSAGASDEDRTLMEIVVREVDRLNTLIEDFLAYARPGAVRRREVRVGEILRDAVTLLARDEALSGGVEVEFAEGAVETADEISLHADSSQVQQVLWNLLRNACEAMPGGGTIRIDVALAHDLRSGRDVVTIAISDTGPGLPSTVLDNLFEPFFTTKEGGTGLGLATCHRIVTSHKGTLTAENPEGGGARFTITLPIEATTPTREATTSVEVFSALVDPAKIARSRAEAPTNGDG
jgi:two-component system sensor histidine kinase PilS (NtrC family)